MINPTAFGVTDEATLQPDNAISSQSRCVGSLDTNIDVRPCGAAQASLRNLGTSTVTEVDYRPNAVVQAQTDTGQRNGVTPGADDMDVPPQCGQFYDVALDETPRDAAQCSHPPRLVHDGRLGGMMAEPRRCVIALSRCPFDTMTPGGYTSIAVPEARQCMIPSEHHPSGATRLGDRFTMASQIRPPYLTQDGHYYQLRYTGQPSGLVPDVHQFEAPMHGPPAHVDRDIEPFAMALHDDRCGMPQHYHPIEVPRPMSQQEVAVERFLCRATPATPMYHVTQVVHPKPLERDCYAQHDAPPEVTAFPLSQSEDRPTPCCATASPCIQPTPRTMHGEAARKPFDRAISCCADQCQSCGTARDVEANQIRMRRRWDITDQPVRPFYAPSSNYEACLARQARQQMAPLCAMGKEPPCEERREFTTCGDTCDSASCAIMREVPSCELMPEVSRETASCEITCETTMKRKEWWIPLDERPIAAVIKGLSPKIMRDQAYRAWSERNTRNCSRRIQRNAVLQNGPRETTGAEGKLCEDSRDRKRCKLCQDEAMGGAELDGVMAVTSTSRHSRQDSAPAAAMVRAQMQWDYYIPGLPDNSKDDGQSFLSRRREDTAKPADGLPPKPNVECLRTPPTEVHHEPADEEDTGPVSWTRFLRRATRKAFHVVCQVVKLIATDAKPAALSLPAAPGGNLSVPRVPRLERSALCRRCLREEATTASEKLHAAPSQTSSSFLARYFISGSSHVSNLSDGLRQCIHNMEVACAHAAAFPHSTTLPAPVPEKSLSDPALPLQRVSCPHHSTGSPWSSSSHSDSLLHEMTSMSTNADADPSDTNDDQEGDCEDTSSATYTTARPTSEHANDDSELSESHLLSPWHNIDQYSLAFVDATDFVVSTDRGDGGDSLDDVTSLKMAHVKGEACTLSWSETTATDLHSLDSGDICRKSDFSDDDMDDVLDSTHDVINDVIADQQ